MKNKLSIEIESLRARLDIRDFFLNNVVREIYENIGQVLSLVRMDLGATGPPDKTSSRIASSGLLIGKSIRDLRLMGKNFSPDTELLQENGFIESVKKVIDVLYPINAPNFCVAGKQSDFHSEVKLITFNVLIKMIFSLKQDKQIFSELAILFTSTSLQIELFFEYENKTLGEEGKQKEAKYFIQELTVIRGKLTVSKNKIGKYVWKLMIPIKNKL